MRTQPYYRFRVWGPVCGDQALSMSQDSVPSWVDEPGRNATLYDCLPQLRQTKNTAPEAHQDVRTSGPQTSQVVVAQS